MKLLTGVSIQQSLNSHGWVVNTSRQFTAQI